MVSLGGDDDFIKSFSVVRAVAVHKLHLWRCFVCEALFHGIRKRRSVGGGRCGEQLGQERMERPTGILGM